MHPVSTNVIPAGQNFHHLTDIDAGKTYSMDLMVFREGLGAHTEIFQKIVIMPRYGECKWGYTKLHFAFIIGHFLY